MKATAFLSFLCFSVLPLHAADELLIPTELNALAPKIRAGMTIREVEALLSMAFPKVKGKRGLWPGQTGFIDYQLDDQLLLSVASTGQAGQELVDQNILFYIVNRAQKHRLDIKTERQSEDGRSAPTSGDLLIPFELSAVIPKIRGSMTISEVEALLSNVYPKVKSDWGLWSGQTGYTDYRLNDHLLLSVASYNRGGMAFVGEDLLFYISDRSHGNRAEIKSDFWIIPERK